jgi:LAO/AO transport system kinase
VNRTELAQAITLAESTRPDHIEQTHKLLDDLLPQTGNSLRIGITGVPGVGKSTLIERLGMHIIEQGGGSVAVLTIDPSSEISKGSLLGDKTRMPLLSAHPQAFVRPTPSGGTLGGVAGATRIAILLCEAAGYRTIIVETVGVGQSEIAVHSLVDFVVLLLLPASGDEVQSIKRGIVEIADLIAVNKADGPLRIEAEATATRMHATTCSAHTGAGIPEIWQAAHAHPRDRRAAQSVRWLREEIEANLRRQVALLLPEYEAKVKEGQLPPYRAAQQLLESFRS